MTPAQLELWELEVAILITYIDSCENPAEALRKKGHTLLELANALEGLSRDDARRLIRRGADYAAAQARKKSEKN